MHSIDAVGAKVIVCGGDDKNPRVYIGSSSKPKPCAFGTVFVRATKKQSDISKEVIRYRWIFLGTLLEKSQVNAIKNI